MSKNWRRKIRRWLTQQLELPEDVMMDVPRITMVGQLHIYIENHKGLLSFSDMEFRVLLTHGQLLVKGEDFTIKAILPDELILEGKIHQVTYINEK